VGDRGDGDGKIDNVGEHDGTRYLGVEGGNVEKEREWGDRGPLLVSYGDWGREVGGGLED